MKPTPFIIHRLAKNKRRRYAGRMLGFFVSLLFISCSLLCPIVTNAQAACSQTEREALMKQAEDRQFTLRRVTFIGLTQTPDEKMRNQMRDFDEGDIFLARS